MPAKCQKDSAREMFSWRSDRTAEAHVPLSAPAASQVHGEEWSFCVRPGGRDRGSGE